MSKAFPSAEIARVHAPDAFPTPCLGGKPLEDRKHLMSVNLHHTTIDPMTGQPRESVDQFNARAIARVAGRAARGVVFIAEETADAVARLLECAVLTNAKIVNACLAEPRLKQSSFVPGFGPCLLTDKLRNSVRALLIADRNGVQATALFDLLVELRLQLCFIGKDDCRPHMQALNSPADSIDISRTSHNMAEMFKNLGLGYSYRSSKSDMVALSLFKRAVEIRGNVTDMPERLKAFVACAERNGATHVYWG